VKRAKSRIAPPFTLTVHLGGGKSSRPEKSQDPNPGEKKGSSLSSYLPFCNIAGESKGKTTTAAAAIKDEEQDRISNRDLCRGKKREETRAQGNRKVKKGSRKESKAGTTFPTSGRRGDEKCSGKG